MTLRPRPAVASWRTIACALAVSAAAVACSGVLTGPDGPDTRPRGMTVSPTSLTIALGDTARLTAALFDVTGAPAMPEAGTTLTYASDDTLIARVDATGLVTGTGGGTTTVRGVYGALTLGVPVTITVRPRIVVVSGDGQTGEQGDTLAQPIVVRALDAAGQPLANATVDFVLLTGAGALTATADTTDATGLAQVRWVLGLPLGAQTLRAERAGSDSAVLSAVATVGTKVRRVAVTMPRTAFIGAGDTVRATARAYNVVDTLIAGVAFTWSSSDTTIAVVAPTGLVTSRAPGVAYVYAANGTVRDSVQVTVQPAAPTGVKHWSGNVSAAWDVAANWSEGAVPLATDSVVIPATGIVTMPIVPPVSVRAFVSLNAQPMTFDGDGDIVVQDAFVVRSDVAAVSCVNGATLRLVAPTTAGPHPLAGNLDCPVTLSGSGSRVLVDSLVLGSSLDLIGTTRLTLAGHVIELGGQPLGVHGTARLEMTQASDRVRAGSVTFAAGGNGDMLAAGELQVRYGLAVVAAGGSFVTGTAHRVVLQSPVPTDTATLTVAAGVRFGQLDVRMPAKVNGTFTLAGDANVTASGRIVGVAVPAFGLPERLRVEGDFTAAAGATTVLRAVELGGALVAPDFTPDTLVLIGTNQRLPLDGTVSGLRSVRVAAGASATARVLVNQRRFLDGDLVVEGDFGVSEAFVAAMGINGSLRVTGSGILRLGGTYGSLRVEGNALFDGRAMTNEFATGDIELRGDLVQRATTSANSLRATSNFTFYLIGTGAIDFATPDSSWVSNVEHWGSLTRTLRTDLQARGVVRYDLNNVVVRSDVLGAGGTRRITASGLDMGGVVTSRNVAFRVLDGAPIDLTGGPTFQDFDPSAVQLDLQRTTGAVTLGFPTFATVPVGGGRYLRVSDPDGATGGVFTVNVQSPSPATHGGFAEAIAPAVINGWPSGVAVSSLDLDGSVLVAAGMQQAAFLRFPAPLAAAATITIRSIDSTVALVSADTAEAGVVSRLFGAVAGETGLAFRVHAIEGTAGSAFRVVAEASGFAPDTLFAVVAAPVFQVGYLGLTSLTPADSIDPVFAIAVGYDAGESGFQGQALRVGGTGAAFTVTVTDSLVGRLEFHAFPNTGGSDQPARPSAPFTLQPGFAQTYIDNAVPGFAASLRFRRAGASGTTTLSVASPAGWSQIGGIPTITVQATPVVGPAARIERVSGDSARVPVGTAIPAPLVARVVDANGLAVAGFEVTWSGTFGCCNPLGTQVDTSDANGLVSFTFTMPNIASVVQSGLTATGLTGSPLGFMSFATPRAATTALVRFGTGGGTAGAPITPGWTVWAVDEFNNIDTTFTGAITMTLTNGPAFATLGGTTVRNAVAGVADFNDLTVNVANSSWVLVASSPGLASTASQAFSINVPVTLTLVGGNLLAPGAPATVRATVPVPAYGSGFSIGLTSNNPSIVAVSDPDTVLIPPGQIEATFTVTGVGLGFAFLNATIDGVGGGQLGVTVTNQIISMPTTLDVALGQSAALPIQLTAPAPAGGLTVSLVTRDASRVGVTTSSVFFAPGATLGNGTVTGASLGSALVVASAPGWVSDSTTVTTSAALNIIETGLSLNGSFGTTMGIEMRSGGVTIAAPPGGVTISLSAADPSCVSLPATANLAAGSALVTVPVTYGGSAPLPCSTRLLVTAPGIASDSLDVSVAPRVTITGYDLRLGSGTQSNTYFILSASNYGTTTVRIESTDPSIVRVAPNRTTAGGAFLDVPLTQPYITGDFTLSAMEGVTGVVPVVLSAPGFAPDTLLVTVRPLGVEIISLTPTTSSLAQRSAFQVRIGYMNVGNTALEGELELRFGGVPIDVTVTNSDAAVAQLFSQAGSGQSATLTIPVLSTRTQYGASAGGVEFDPLTPGVTTVSVTGAGLVSPATASQQVTVTASAITINDARIGSGLQSNTYAQLGAPDYGSGTVRVRSLDPALVLVAPQANVAGTEFIDIPMTAPNVGMNVTVSALEGVTGVGRVEVSMPGFIPDTAFVTVRGRGVELLSLPQTTSSLSPSTAFFVRIGILDATGTSIESELPVRTGGVPIPVTVTNSNAAVAQLATATDTAQSIDLAIEVGNTRTLYGLGAGGIVFDPLAPGSTTVQVTSPAATPTTQSSWTVTVVGPAVNAPDVALGSGLQTTSTVTLGASEYGTTTLRIESLDPALVVVAPDANTIGTAFIEIPMTAPTTSINYVLAALEGVTGVGRLLVSAPGFAPDTVVVTVTGLGVEVLSLPAATSTMNPNTPFQARIGYLTAAGTTLGGELPIRAGGSPITVTFQNSAPTVGQLVTSALTGQNVTAVVAVGDTRTQYSVALGGVAFDPLSSGTTTVSVTAPGLTPTIYASQQVTVTSPGISVGNAALGSGLMEAQNAQLGGSTYGSLNVRIESSDPALVRVAPDLVTAGAAFIDVPMTAPSTSVPFVISAMSGVTGAATVTISAPGFTSATMTVTVRAAGVELLAFPATFLVGQPTSVIYARVGRMNPGGTAIEAEQAVRAGSPLTLTFSSEAATIATLETTNQTAASVTTTIAPGNTRTLASVATGGVRIVPNGAGITTISVSAAGTVTTPQSSQLIQVFARTIAAPDALVARGLQVPHAATLENDTYGTIAVRISSSDPSRVRVAPDASTVGAASIDVPMTAPSTNVPFVISADSGATGTVTLTIEGAGFTTATMTVTLRPAGIELLFVPSNLLVGQPTGVIYARVGMMNAGGTAIAAEQSVRAGAPLSVTFSSEVAAVATLETTSQTASSVTTTIAPGNSRTLGSVATGGVRIVPVGAGISTISVFAPGVVPTALAAQQVQVTAHTMTVGNALVAGGLQVAHAATLDNGTYGTIAVRITSSDPSRVRVAPNASTVGAGAIDLVMTAPATNVPFVISAEPGATGTATLTIEGAGFTTATMTVTLRPAGIELFNVPGGLGVGSPSQVFYARTGMLDAGGTAFAAEQEVRAGAPLTLTFTSSDGNVARIETTALVAASVTTTIAPGNSRTLSNIATGGVRVVGIGAGAATIAVTAPNVTAYPGSSFNVLVSP